MENNEEIVIKKEKKKSKLWLIILINVLTVAIAAGGVYYYLEYIAKDEKETQEKTPEVETEADEKEVFKTSVIELEDYVYRYDTLHIADIENEKLYAQEKLTPADLSIKDINITVLRDMDYPEPSFSLEQYNSSLVKLYGEEFAKTIEPANIRLFETTNEDIFDYIYDPTTEMFTYIEIPLGGIGPYRYLRKVNEVEYGNNTMIITIGLLDCEYHIFDPTKPRYTCSNLDSDEIIKEFHEENLMYNWYYDYENLYEKMTKFDYNYEYDEELDNYYLVSIIRK